MVDDKLERDELQRAANYEAIKSDVKAEVGGEIAAEAQVPTPSQAQRVENIADDMRHKAVNEVVQTEREVERGRSYGPSVADRRLCFFSDLRTYLRFGCLLALFAAREGNGFVQFVRADNRSGLCSIQGHCREPDHGRGIYACIADSDRDRCLHAAAFGDQWLAADLCPSKGRGLKGTCISCAIGVKDNYSEKTRF